MTSKPLSTISYNSKEFLISKLEELRAAKKISIYVLIFHKGEGGDKDHFHVYLEPNGRIEPMSLIDYFKEPVPDNPKPLGTMPWRPSKIEDWVLYGKHDAEYLEAKYKGDKNEKLPYTLEDFISSDGVDIENIHNRAKASFDGNSTVSITKRLMQGAHATDLLLEGINPHSVKAVQALLRDDNYYQVVHENTLLRTELDGLKSSISRIGYNIKTDGSIIMLEQNDNPEKQPFYTKEEFNSMSDYLKSRIDENNAANLKQLEAKQSEIDFLKRQIEQLKSEIISNDLKYLESET